MDKRSRKQTFDRSRACLWLTLLAVALAVAGACGPKSSPLGNEHPDDVKKAQFLTMFARGYYRGRSGQLFVVPRDSEFVSLSDTALYFFMHGSPWDYDTRIPLVFFWPGHVRSGTDTSSACQQDIVPTLAKVLNLSLPATVTGRALPVWQTGSPPPALVVTLVLDGGRADYLQRMPKLAKLTADSGAYFPNAQINYLPTNTAVGHSTIATGSDPRIHGVVGNSTYDIVHGKKVEPFLGGNPDALLVPTLGDLWLAETRGRAHIMAQGGNIKAGTALAGHGRRKGRKGDNPVWLVAYDENTGRWTAGTTGIFSLPPSFGGRDALWQQIKDAPPGPDSLRPKHARHSPDFAKVEGKVAIETIRSLPLKPGDVSALAFINLKTLDFVGHAYGPQSKQMERALREVDDQVAAIVQAVREKSRGSYVMVVTADHGMPPGDKADPAEGWGKRRHITDEFLAFLNATSTQRRDSVAFYDGENAQIYMRDTLAVRDTIAVLARRLETKVFAVFPEDSVLKAAARLH